MSLKEEDPSEHDSLLMRPTPMSKARFASLAQPPHRHPQSKKLAGQFFSSGFKRRQVGGRGARRGEPEGRGTEQPEPGGKRVTPLTDSCRCYSGVLGYRICCQAQWICLKMAGLVALMFGCRRARGIQ